MKNIYKVLIAVAIVLYLLNSISCFVFAEDKEANKVFDDLTDIRNLEASEMYNKLLEYAQSILAMEKEAVKVENTLDSMYYLGYARTSFSISKLNELFEWKVLETQESSPFFKSKEFEDYYKLRLDSFSGDALLKLNLSDKSYTADSTKSFNEYFDKIISDTVVKERLIFLTQDKLLDKLTELGASDSDNYLLNVLLMKKDSNLDSVRRFTYQLYESRIRLALLEKKLEQKIIKLQEKAGRVSMSVFSNVEGALTTENGTIIKAFSKVDEGSYKCIVPFSTIVNTSSYNLKLSLKNKELLSFSNKELSKAIGFDEKGGITLSIEKAIEARSGKEAPIIKDEGSNKQNGELDSYKQFYDTHKNKAEAIISHIMKYSYYSDLKSKNLKNSYVISFESEKTSWKESLKSMLHDFQYSGGSDRGYSDDKNLSDFVLFIRDFVNYNRNESSQSADKSKLIGDFRQNVLSFMKLEEANVWLIDMMYKIFCTE